MPTFRPSARIRLAIRIDEGTDTGALEGRLDQGSAQAPGGVGLPGQQASGASSREEINAALESVQTTRRWVAENRDAFSPQALDFFDSDLDRQRDELQARLTTSGGAGSPPDATAGASPDDRVVLGTILPKTLTIERNGLRTADTATISLDHRDAPFDPRLIRSVAIEAVVGVVDPDAFERGVLGETRADGSLMSLVPRGMAGAADALPGTTRFVGVVDEWGVTFSGEDGDVLDLECRDLTAILIDTMLPAGDGLDMSIPIDRAIRELLNRQPSTRGTSVRFGIAGEEGDAPTPAICRRLRARGGSVARRRRQGGQQLSLWDHITETCTQMALVPVFEDNELRIIRPRTFYENRDVARRMIYGRNLESLGFSRKLSGVKVPTIEVRSYDCELGRTRWARYPVPGSAPTSGVFGETDPPRVARANEVPPSGQNPDDRIQTFTLAGITDPDTLSAAAESIWQQIGRQEIEGKIRTSDVWSWEQPVQGVDLLRLRPGDALEILVASPETAELGRETTLTSTAEIRGLQREARARYLERIGWSRRVAERFSALQDAVSFQTIFRVQNVRILWDVEDGLALEIDFSNFLEIRELSEEGPQVGTPSPQVAALTAGQTDAASRRLQTISISRSMATVFRENGLLTEEAYARRMDELTMRERQGVGDVQGPTQ